MIGSGLVRLRVLAIIALTAGALTSERQLAETAGMNDFLSKPFNMKALVRAIEACLTSPRAATGPTVPGLRTVVGESEPIRNYGVLLDDATLRQEAFALGITKTTKDALTPQQKVLAAQSAIFKQTTDAQGDFARTSDSAANAQRIPYIG